TPDPAKSRSDQSCYASRRRSPPDQCGVPVPVLRCRADAAVHEYRPARPTEVEPGLADRVAGVRGNPEHPPDQSAYRGSANPAPACLLSESALNIRLRALARAVPA